MAEVKLNGLYKVTVTEYEAGWGQRPCDDETRFFTTREEAETYAESCNQGTYEIYWRARIDKVS
jgi:hypothetical protein